MISGNDITYMTEAVAQIGSWAERPVTVFEYSSIGTSGTTAEAGDPQTVTFGTRSDHARFNKVDLKDVERSKGRYQQDDQMVTLRGSFDKKDMVYMNGTYGIVDGPWKVFMGSTLIYQGVARKVQS